MFDVWLMLIFGVMGYVFKKLDYPLAPMVLALVLGDRAEDSFRQSMLLSQGDMSIFFATGLVGTITGLDGLRRLRALAVHRHVSRDDRFHREGARLEEARGPEPFVDPQGSDP